MQDAAHDQISVKELYPHLSDEELLVAEDNLKRYVLLACEVYEDLEKPKAVESFDTP